MNNMEDIKGAVDFLMYSYFGLTLDDNEKVDSIVDKAISLAFKDATNQGAFNSIVDTYGERSRENLVDKGSSYVKNGILNINKELDYDKWHHDICLHLVDLFKDCKTENKECAFSYGNAQKWMNMTVKNLYVLYKLFRYFEDEECEFCKTLQELMNSKQFFHVPLDSYILDSLWSTILTESGNRNEYLPNNSDKPRRKDYIHPHDHIKPWSTWDEKDYYGVNELDNNELNKNRKLQKIIKDKTQKDPIDWEGQAWIEQAKKRKGEH